jgi:hypothetical protein
MALCDATCILPGVACAAVGATCLAPACLPAGSLPASLWILQVAAIAPVIWCAFWSPAAALGAFGLSHSVEWDEVDGKFVGVEDDTIMFGPEGEALYGDVYCPMTAEDELAVQEAQAETMRRRSIDATERAARGEEAEPDFGPLPVAFGLGRAAHVCASVVACPAGPADGQAAATPETRLKDD